MSAATEIAERYVIVVIRDHTRSYYTGCRDARDDRIFVAHPDDPAALGYVTYDCALKDYGRLRPEIKGARVFISPRSMERLMTEET